MKYQVIARKFRPQVFEDVVGQSPIVQTLRNAIDMDRIGHAYLFSGPRGVGKTTMARLLAKALNCEKGPTSSPCNDCASCSEVATGGSIDVLEIDAASNTGVDSIRELRENARYAPSRDRFKIFIIDEVHMLSTSAFNALLKTLEEPPEHVAFIMATTERHKLPATILSRCQQFVFRSIPPPEIQAHLQTIAQRERVQIGEGALEYVVKAAGGSMRDAQSLLDQIIAYGGQKISDDEVRDVLGFMPANLLNDSLIALGKRDPVRLLEVVERVADQGLNFQQFVRELLSEIRSVLLCKVGLNDKLSGSPDDKTRIEAHAAGFSEQDLIRFFGVLTQLDGDLRWTSEPRFHLEVACVKLCTLGKLRDLEDVIRDLKADVTEAGTRPDSIRPNPPVRLPAAGEDRNAAIESTPPETPSTPAQPAQGTPRRRVATANQPRVQATAAKAPAGDRSVVSDRDGPSPGKPTPGKREAESQAVSPDPHVSSSQTGDVGDTAKAAAMVEAARREPVVQRFLDVFRGEIAHVKSTNPPEEPEDGR
jgi:DNA polymerase-3 subunit gamma/tau